MSGIIIKVEALAGSDIGTVCKKLVKLSSLLETTITCDFNGVLLMCRQGDTANALEEDFHRLLRLDRPYKIATGGAHG
jgi:hypothetical protein